MQIYMVGGAVRDRLLGLPVQDRDWVVVGATPEDMVARGFVPVGKDFPVFLHPQTHEEYALARTERKSGRGYKGFTVLASPDVTLEEDLARRDLTINSIAAQADWDCPEGLKCVDLSSGLIDPFDGVRDLRAGVLRHVTGAFREDPVRILRLARFAARFHHFRIAPETQSLLREMVADGEAAHLVAERVWQELSRGLMQARPSRMLEVLHACGALAVVLPEVAALAPWVQAGRRLLRTLDVAAALQAPLAVRYACLMLAPAQARLPVQAEAASGVGLADGIDSGAVAAPPALPASSAPMPPDTAWLAAASARLRVPADCQALAELVAREHRAIHGSGALTPAGLVALLERCDAFRRPARFADALLACECDAHGRAVGEVEEVGASGGEQAPHFPHLPYPPRGRLLGALAVAQAVDTAAVARQAAAQGARGPQIGQAIAAARAQAVACGGGPARDG
ncbi:multifunctional CCA tRNA nucleotidyl transferase/2'3'-cyclic phosphodiesterase/2'nucleotidase/phosphatase [Comamonadaceae bacterium OH2545_COT-014]|nr:multifunctional CCA tRNA nucleotidyl transferase/2'3'-cyclic phosphodiesterase/2'nucleotidase/phosphatase [Comamonadaceae bacterium OH2545_COT-014]